MNKPQKNPVQGGVRRRYIKMPMLSGSGDSSVVRYSTLGSNVGTGATVSGTVFSRYFCPGYPGGLVNASGPALTSYYSTGKFMPGTTVRWEPSVSFTTNGRVIVGFTDNPEMIVTVQTLLETFITTPSVANFNAYLAAVKGMGSVRAFPVWQETSLPFPQRLRRRRFDTNVTINTTDPNVVDRSVQVAMFVAIEGPPLSTTLGSFHFHDVIDVEGITGLVT